MAVVKKDAVGKWRVTLFATAIASLASGSMCANLWDAGYTNVWVNLAGNFFALSLIASFVGIIFTFVYAAWDESGQ